MRKIPLLIKLLKKLIRSILNKFKSCLFVFYKFLFLLIKPSIAVTYSNDLKTDGLGAQIQRIIALHSLSCNLKIGYLHSGIKNIAIHPLDPYQSESDVEAFLEKINRQFTLESQFNPLSEIKLVKVNQLTFRKLFNGLAESLFRRKYILFQIVEPYRVSDFDQQLYSHTKQSLKEFSPTSFEKFTVVIHYRRGVGGLAIQKGELLSRELLIGYFDLVISEVLKTQTSNQIRILVHTDAPSTDLDFKLPEDQINLWENSPCVEEGIMHVKGMDLEKHFADLGYEVQVCYGGDPLVALQDFAGADVLVMSRSSLSYVGGILNRDGIVYFPESFWHPPLKKWKVMKAGTF